ncbi:hypothetical protein FB451DRAFT_1560569 [Mycena latifolia]|nr:hypothetical protein FB451DRAFT_1560569 [Mycena latifolia]
MSPRGSSSASTVRIAAPRSVSTSYRRGEPKSSRQQYSACGACRMRRVRCDLKDLTLACGPNSACSNCQERDLKCVDEFADVKAVKLLRTGRRLQKVEAIYGKGAADDSAFLNLPSATRPPSAIPQLKPEFFSSPFWSWFSLQKPILDPTEFPARFFAHTKGTQLLGHEGKVLMLVLTVWAASFGLDERGLPENDESSRPSSPSDDGSKNTSRMEEPKKNRALITEGSKANRKRRIEAMAQEILLLIDSHAIMRRPTWDGVRVLLLTLPLMEAVSVSALDRRCMHEAALYQAALCTLSGEGSMSLYSSPHASDDTIIRARILWYSHIYEGITTGLRGGRFVLSDDDIDAFQTTLPAFGFDLGSNDSSPYPSPVSPSFPPGVREPALSTPFTQPQGSPPQLDAPLPPYLSTAESFEIPLHLSSVCRRAYAVLTGPRAVRRVEEGGGVDAEGMWSVWDGLDQCWEAFEALRHRRASHAEDFHVFISAWQIFIFECHNVIRETLKQNSMQDTRAIGTSSLSSASTSSHSTFHGAIYLPPQELYAIASRRCLRLLPSVLTIIRSHLVRNGNRAILFSWDAGLVRDGCFFAGFLCASIDNDAPEFVVENREFKHADMGSVRSELDAEEGVQLCFSALREMSWAFSRSEEREETVRRIWEDKRKRKLEHRHAHHAPAPYDLDSHSQSRTTYPEPSSFHVRDLDDYIFNAPSAIRISTSCHSEIPQDKTPRESSRGKRTQGVVATSTGACRRTAARDPERRRHTLRPVAPLLAASAAVQLDLQAVRRCGVDVDDADKRGSKRAPFAKELQGELTRGRRRGPRLRRRERAEKSLRQIPVE